MPHISKGLTQAYELQDFAHDAAMALKNQLTVGGKLLITREDSQAISNLVKSWEACQQRIQVHRRVPNPGSMKWGVTSRPKRKQSSQANETPLPSLPASPPEPPAQA
jgi:hypothetical protein